MDNLKRLYSLQFRLYPLLYSFRVSWLVFRGASRLLS